MAIRGQKVHIDLEDDGPVIRDFEQPLLATNFIGDIMERKVDPSSAPQPPNNKTSGGGFPAHKKRTGQSRFKSSRSGEDQPRPRAAVPERDARPARDPSAPTLNALDEEKRQIDSENRAKLESMSEAEIEEERRELLDSLNPSLLQALLRKAEYNPGGDDTDFPGLDPIDLQPEAPRKSRNSSKKVTFDDDVAREKPMEPEGSSDTPRDINDDEDDDGYGIRPTTTADATSSIGNIHFPRPQQPPDLDPSSSSFLEDLHQKYFPSLPADPDKLEWMRPITGPSAYSSSQQGLDPKDIRFAFSGALIPPSAAAEIPVTAGLHHHGEAADAAGYTIPELARLGRSSVPSQRCIAYQTLGRILYRLGKGEFGNPSDGKEGTLGAGDTFGELARGLWREVEREQVIEICTVESEGQNGKHVSAQAYATEAIWLWQKGGGRRFKSD